MPPGGSSVMLAKRLRMYMVGALFVLILFILLHSRQPPPAPAAPLPGTFQYFAETDFHSQDHRFGAVSHCDPRFAPKQKPEAQEVRRTLNALLRSYTAFMEELQIESWITHGALLGWYWNKKLLPWDTDLDVQMSAENLESLATSRNMTEYQYPRGEGRSNRTYLLDINPHYAIVSERDVANKIDGRWIDRTDGKFIDITAVHHDRSEQQGKAAMVYCKDGHRYKEVDIYPLKTSTLQDTKVYVPSKYENILREEYGRKALTNEHFHWHHFNRKTHEWEFE